MKRLLTPEALIGILIIIIFSVMVWFSQEKQFGAIDEVSKTKLGEKYNLATEIKAKYVLDNASLVKTDIKNPELDKYKGEPKDEIKITLGDKDKTEFVPNIELKRWNEVSFKLKTDNLLSTIATKDKNLTFDTDKIKFDTPKISFEMYDYTEGEGGYKFIWYLNEKPATNKVEFQIESSGLDFFYQPPLTQEYQNGYSQEFQKEIVVTETQVKDLDGNVLVERPENVVGSYAVYHSTKGGMNDTYGKEYKVGKAFHIYRPHIIDASGAETWGILKIENGIYSVEIPQDFLDTAIYPIKSNDTFGYSTTADSYSSSFLDYWRGTLYTSPANAEGATVQSLTIKLDDNNGSRYFKGILVLGSDKNIVTNGIGNATLLQTYGAYKTSNFSTNPTISANTNYYLGYVAQAVDFYFDSETGYSIQGDDTNSYASPINPTDMSSKVSNARLAAYATYTPSGGGATPKPKPEIWWE